VPVLPPIERTAEKQAAGLRPCCGDNTERRAVIQHAGSITGRLQVKFTADSNAIILRDVLDRDTCNTDRIELLGGAGVKRRCRAVTGRPVDINALSARLDRGDDDLSFLLATE